MRFEWDNDKATTNQREHGVSFIEALEVFNDSGAIERYDSLHSESEARFGVIGWSSRRLLLVVFTERGHGEEVVRLISARPATRYERETYDKQQVEQQEG